MQAAHKHGMRALLSTVVVGLLLVLGLSSAQANRSKFEVQEVKPLKNGNYSVTVATQHYTKASKADFYLFTKMPEHNTDTIKKTGLSIGSITMQVGAGSHTFEVKKADIKKLKVKVGAEIFVSAVWPDFGHRWGTDLWNRNDKKTRFTLPKPKANTARTRAPKVDPNARPKESFPKGMPLQYQKPIWSGAREKARGQRERQGKATNELGRHADIRNLPPAQRNFAEAGSLLESEGKVGLAGKRDLRITVSLLKKLSKDPKLAEKVLGKGWSVNYTATYTFNDAYKDNKTHDLAKTEAGLRVRRVPGSGQPGQVNFKDPGGVRDGPNGIVMSRTERFVTIGDKPNLKKLVDSKHYLAPTGNLKNASSYLGEGAKQSQKRVRFQLNYAEKGKTPQAVAEITADNVFDYRPIQGKKDAKHNRVTFYGLEVDIAHQPVDGSGKAVDFISAVKNWQPTHKASDVKYLKNDKSIQKTYKAIGKLMDHLANNNVKVRPTVPKYTEGLLRAGVIKPTTDMQKKILTRGKKNFLKAKKPVRSRTNGSAASGGTAARTRTRARR